MNALDSWIRQATRNLASDSAARVRTEIQEHYEAAFGAAVAKGSDTREADRLALAALGDARTVNCQYRRVFLTSAEANLLSEGNWEARTFCSRRRLKWVFLAIPIAAAAVAITLFVAGRAALALNVLALAIGMAPLAAAPFLPIYTRARGRVFRSVKWVAMTGALLLAFGPETFKWSWLLFLCLWPMVWTEWSRASIRRKLPMAKWPRQLYF
jgi:hypothetical protein